MDGMKEFIQETAFQHTQQMSFIPPIREQELEETLWQVEQSTRTANDQMIQILKETSQWEYRMF